MAQLEAQPKCVAVGTKSCQENMKLRLVAQKVDREVLGTTCEE